jgi:ribonuclease BN (tRNA processing enzyme)
MRKGSLRPGIKVGAVSNRELVVLGTASQVPTRARNHNGYFLRWDDDGLLFDPGEGTQRQMLFAGVTAHQVTRVCVTHFHGDHSLGLPGVLQRMALDQVTGTIEVAYHWRRAASPARTSGGCSARAAWSGTGAWFTWPTSARPAAARSSPSSYDGEIILAADLDRVPVPPR